MSTYFIASTIETSADTMAEEQPHAQPVDVHGLTFMAVDGAQDIPPLLESEHDDISHGGFCHRCWDEAMLESGIGLSFYNDTSA